MISRNEWKYRGIAGHFCASNHCRFHVCTDIGKYRVSTVGAYYPPGHKGVMETIGCDRHYETMVFAIDEQGFADFGNEVDFEGLKFDGVDPYTTDKIAEEMHERMCLKWAEQQA